MTCWHAFQTATVTKLDNKYKVAGCCRAKGVGYTDSIENIKNFEPMQEFRKKFLDGIEPSECFSCYEKEEAGVPSKRTKSLPMFDHDPIDVNKNGFVNHHLVSWDIRPESTCNLKCLMCNPNLSSKWEEDKDIWNKYFTKERNKYQQPDWNYIYNNTVGTAKRIYIAGGEPFYIKNVVRYLDKLSKNKFNVENTKLVIQTNGTTSDYRLLEVCKKFKMFDLCVSIDGVGEVDDIIRYPGKWNNKLRLWQEFKNITNYLAISTTVQALNLPDLDNLLLHFDKDIVSFNKLVDPDFLSLNALKPEIIKDVKENTSIPEIKQFCNDYNYDEALNITMQKYLLDCDNKRETNSKETLPWCFV